jgi:DNA-binding NarL/FixJ family response regulator
MAHRGECTFRAEVDFHMPTETSSDPNSIASSLPQDAGSGERRWRPTPSVFILSDVRLYREGLALSLSRQTRIAVKGVAEISPRGLSQVIEHKPDVIILDVGGSNSFDFARSLTAQSPAMKIIAFAVNEIEEDVLACANAGFAGYVPHEGSEADLLAAIDHAMRGELYCSPRVAGLLFRHLAITSARHAPPTEPTMLTRREQHVLELLAQGMSNKEIAREARISSATVKNHVHNILEKLQVRRRGEAAARLPTLQLARRTLYPRYVTADTSASA